MGGGVAEIAGDPGGGPGSSMDSGLTNATITSSGAATGGLIIIEWIMG